jgi:hypothetical protein
MLEASVRAFPRAFAFSRGRIRGMLPSVFAFFMLSCMKKCDRHRFFRGNNEQTLPKTKIPQRFSFLPYTRQGSGLQPTKTLRYYIAISSSNA